MRVREIHFNHDLASATADALTIREDAEANTVIQAPEWNDGMTSQPIAYTLDALKSPIAIKVRLTEGPLGETRRIRAKRIFPGNAGLLTPLGFSTGELGAVAKRYVEFDLNGESGLIEFQATPGMGAAINGVGISDVVLQWQQYTGGRWRNFYLTQHQLFRVIAAPTSPWTQQTPEPPGESLPWVSALRKACLWAAGAQTIEEAAEAITIQLNSQSKQAYQTASAHIIESELQLANYLQNLDGQVNFTANCRDIAAVLAAFVNLLGGNVQMLRITNLDDDIKFETKRVLALFGSGWAPQKFNRHFVVLDPATVPNGAVNNTSLTPDQADAALMYDACLQVNELDQELPVRMAVGNVTGSGYRFELIMTGDGEVATPIPVLPVE